MNNFKHNFSELRILANEKILFWNKDKNFEVKPPTLKDTLFNQEFSWLISFLDTDIEELSKNFRGFTVTSHFSFILIISTLGYKKEEYKSLYESFLIGMKTFLPEIKFDGLVYSINSVFLDQVLFEEIIGVIYKILRKERIVILDSDDEFTKIEKQQKIRALRIRQNSQKTKKKGSFENALASILYEFPQYKLEDLFDLNVFTFNFLLGYIGKIANYEVTKIAAGNGLTKKHKYFVE